MKYGLSDKTVLKINSVLLNFSEIQTAILYGSRAKGNFKPGSDIDLALMGHALDNSIANDIDDLLLPYTVDLSIYKDIKNKDLLDHITRVGIVFYKRDSA